MMLKIQCENIENTIWTYKRRTMDVGQIKIEMKAKKHGLIKVISVKLEIYCHKEELY